jgi:hypothetical protein
VQPFERRPWCLEKANPTQESTTIEAKRNKSQINETESIYSRSLPTIGLDFAAKGSPTPLLPAPKTCRKAGKIENVFAFIAGLEERSNFVRLIDGTDRFGAG